MAIVRIPNEQRTLTEAGEITPDVASIGIDYERWALPPGPSGASSEEVLAHYQNEIAVLKKRGGYVTADVVDVSAQTPGLAEMLARFNREHWHNEDEVRFIVEGRGVFHIHRDSGAIAAVEVEPGDMIRVRCRRPRPPSTALHARRSSPTWCRASTSPAPSGSTRWCSSSPPWRGRPSPAA